MKKYLYIIVCATLILISTSVVNAANEVYYTNRRNIEMTEREYNNLLGLGFSETDIARMDQEEFNLNKDLEGELLGEATKYYRITTHVHNGIKETTKTEITKEEALYEKALQAQKPLVRGPVGSYYNDTYYDTVIEELTRIVGINNTYMRFHNKVTWYTMPDEQYYDIIGIGMESAKVKFGSGIVFRENWTDAFGTDGYTQVCRPVSTSTGGYVVFELPGLFITQLDAYMYFNVQKQNGVGTITSLYAGGDYAHGITSIDPDDLLDHLSVNYGSGIVIDSTYTNDFAQQTSTLASFIGTW